MDLFLGVHGGVMGETCALAILIGFVWLVATKTISPAIPVTYLATVAVMSLLCGQNVMVQLLSGGLMFGAVFMATDYVTSPFTLKGKIVFGMHHHQRHPLLGQHGRGRVLCHPADEPVGALHQ